MRLNALLAAALVSASGFWVAASTPVHATAGVSGWAMDGSQAKKAAVTQGDCSSLSGEASSYFDMVISAIS